MSDKDGLTSRHNDAVTDTTKHSHVAHNLHAEAYASHHGPEATSTGTPAAAGDPGLAGGGVPPEASATLPSTSGGYDAKTEARKIEDLAKKRLDTGDNDSGHKSAEEIAATKALTNEWASLSPKQRSEVGAQLTKDYNNSSMDALPRPTILTDAKGQVTGLQFEASAWDFHSGPHALRLVEDGNKVVEKINSPKGSAKWEAEYSASR
jgi:hypothetical protein